MSEPVITAEDALNARIAAATAKRAEQAANVRLALLSQEADDAEKLAELEATHPDGFAVVMLAAPMAGYPTFVAARDCKPIELKRYQAGVTTRVVGKAVEVDTGEGAGQLARLCLLYPDAKLFERMCELRAGVATGLGQEIVTRAQAKKAEDSKK